MPDSFSLGSAMLASLPPSPGHPGEARDPASDRTAGTAVGRHLRMDPGPRRGDAASGEARRTTAGLMRSVDLAELFDVGLVELERGSHGGAARIVQRDLADAADRDGL